MSAVNVCVCDPAVSFGLINLNTCHPNIIFNHDLLAYQVCCS